MSECQTLGDRGAESLATAPARLLLVDDHPLIRQALRETFAQERDMAVCGEAGDEAAAMRLIRDAPPDLVLLDLSLGDTSGLDLLRWIRGTHPAIRVLVLSMHDDSLYAERAIQAGARGYVNKRESPDTIVAAIREVLAGGIFLHPALVDRLLQRLTPGGAATDSSGGV